MIKIIEKDILTINTGVIVHQVNCRGIMGGGIAAQIRLKYPKVCEEYSAMCNLVDEIDRYSLLGQAQFCKATPDLFIANVFGQLSTSRNSRETEYYALKHGLESTIVRFLADTEIYLPYNIGCGLGGGDWNIVNRMLERLSETFEKDLTLCKFTPPK